MFGTIETPAWAFYLVVLFAAVTFASHFLFPSVRWFFRRRAERVVAELNKRLPRPIEPFKLLRRQDMIQRVIYDPEVVRAVAEYAREEGMREDVGFEKARDYAREIVPSFSASAYYGIGIRLARFVATKLFDVRLTYVDREALDNIDPDATVVFVMNHRSNFDYVLVTYLAAQHSALSYAAGEWARVWPMSPVIRSMGAYFIRRRNLSPLYRRVLASYVQKATEAGVTQAVFPEGGLSRDGAVGKAKLGILSYIAEAQGRDVVFVPVSIAYDRVVEDRVLVAAGRTGRRQFRGSIFEGLRFALRYIWRRIRGKVGRFGVAAVSFGRPVPEHEVTGGVEELGERLIGDIRKEMPITTAASAAAALLSLGGQAEFRAILQAMVPQTDQRDPEALQQVLDIMVMRHILSKETDSYTIKDPELVEFYANALPISVAVQKSTAT